MGREPGEENHRLHFNTSVGSALSGGRFNRAVSSLSAIATTHIAEPPLDRSE